MEPVPRSIFIYAHFDGSEPYSEWRSSIDDFRVRAAIERRMNRVGVGLFGDHQNVGDGVWEIRIHYGAGYRIYYGVLSANSLVILIGGSKRGQEDDIKKAKRYFQDFKQRHPNENANGRYRD